MQLHGDYQRITNVMRIYESVRIRSFGIDSLFDDFSFFSASIAARAFVSLFGVRPRHFAVASFTPASAKTDRTAPPALNPRPAAAGLIRTLAALYFANTS